MIELERLLIWVLYSARYKLERDFLVSLACKKLCTTILVLLRGGD